MSKKRPTFDPDWQTKYSSMIRTAEEAVSKIQSGQRVFIGTGCAEPQLLVHALANRASELADVELVHLLTFGKAPYADPALGQSFRVNSFFIAENVRQLIQEGLGDYTPIFLSDIPRLFHSGAVPLDVALIQVTPPDELGLCSLGVSVDIVKSAAANASLVIAQVNPRMPRTLGDSFVHIYDLDVLVPAEEPIIERPVLELTEETRQIAEYIAPLIEDGSTLELGIGKIPHALLGCLKGKKDLGIHTEMITDGIVDLVKEGAITGQRKTLDRGKIVASFCLGSQMLYDFIDNSPMFAFRPTEYVNDPFIIGRQHKMVAINVALEVDLTGQVCADSLGTKFFSGIGGQVDFNRGAARAEGGKPIIALPSTAQGGKISRIVARLTPGAGVVTTRGDVHYVVTEYGVAYLHGKSIQERATALISVAHPKFQAELLREAVQAKYLAVELSDKGKTFVVGPRDLRTTYVLRDGTQINFRSIHPTDEPRVRNLFYNLSQQTIYYRFMSVMKRMPRKQLEEFVFVDHRTEVAIAGTIPEASGEEIITIGRYYLDPKTNTAEVAFTVQDDWQRKGIGSFLFQYLARVARRNGIKGFTAEVLAENVGMQKVFNQSNFRTKSSVREGVVHYEIDF
jgi:acyl-CoA hydrolase/GNAT superfamily N-acetyltransferase